MLDRAVRRRIDPWLDALAERLADAGVTANTLTVISFFIGVVAAGSIAGQNYIVGLGLLLVSRLGDGLDGPVARAHARRRDGATHGTDLGGYLDIVLDFGFYALVPLGFVLANPAANAVAGAVLLAAFYFNGASFLAFAALAEKRAARGRPGVETGPKAFLYTVGLMEGTETIVFFVLLCLLPGWFASLAYAFAALTLATTLARIGLAVRTFR